MNNKLFFRLGTSIIGVTVIGLASLGDYAQSPVQAQNVNSSQERSLTKEIFSKKTKLILAQNEADYNRAIQRNPNDVDAYLRRGFLRYEQKNYTGAEADYTQAIRIAPEDATAYLLRGLLRTVIKNYSGAEADYTQAIRIAPEDATAHLGRGLVHHEQKNYSAAEADYTQAIINAPQLVEAYVNRGSVRAYLENYPGAIADLKIAAQLYRQQDPDKYQQIQQVLTQLEALPK